MKYTSNCFKKIVFTLFLITSMWQVSAQEDTSTFWNNVRFGGGIGLSFGTGFFSATLAPSAIYEFNEKFAAGVGLNGTYSSLKNRYDATILGGSVIGLYNVIPQIQLSAEFEELHVSRDYGNLDILFEDYWYSGLFIGAGYRTQHVTVGVRYDVLYDETKSVYANAWAPFVRLYF